jgi:hypothetical protein
LSNSSLFLIDRINGEISEYSDIDLIVSHVNRLYDLTEKEKTVPLDKRSFNASFLIFNGMDVKSLNQYMKEEIMVHDLFRKIEPYLIEPYLKSHEVIAEGIKKNREEKVMKTIRKWIDKNAKTWKDGD